MKVLCIQTSVPGAWCQDKAVIKGEIYTSIDCKPLNQIYNGIDMWHFLEERTDQYHVSIFVELPGQEGVTFKKKEIVLETV